MALDNRYFREGSQKQIIWKQEKLCSPDEGQGWCEDSMAWGRRENW